MKARFVQNGVNLDYTPSSAAVAAGDVIIQGSLVGVAQHDIPKGELGAICTQGVFEMEKATGAITAGASVYWDATAKKATGTSTSNTLIGIAVAAVVSAATVVLVKIG